MRSLNSREDIRHYILIAKISGVHGIKGVLKITSYAQSVETFTPGLRLHGKAPDGCENEFIVQWAQQHSRTVRLALADVTDRNQAETLIGTELFMPRSLLPELEAGTYYWCDIVGLSVFTTNGDFLGEVHSVLPTGSNDVYVVKPTEKDRETEILIPGTASVVVDIDLNEKTMTVELPDGLM
ncbi:MAG: 16S rRNA processing protein RimM [Desulfobacteraceae bacterium]|nr:16S rRNA processing protein RimM [Desulfobacteraceae bacterium]